MDLRLDPDTADVVSDVGRRLGIDADDAQVVHRHSNVVVVLPAANVVLRLATAGEASSRVADSVRVTAFLARRGFPCVVPLDVDQPLAVRGERIASVWHRVPTDDTPPRGGTDLGHLLRDLHATGVPPFPLPPFDDPFDDVASAIEHTPGSPAPRHRAWLLDRIADLRRLWPTLPFTQPWTLIHGDAHPGNTMNTDSGTVVLGDWDHTAVGPREWDLVQMHYTHRRFHRPDESALDELARAYGWDLRSWEGLDTLIAAREITGLSPYIRHGVQYPTLGAELARRVDDLIHGDTAHTWASPKFGEAPDAG